MFYDGTGKELDSKYVMQEFGNYVTFKEAAKMIDPFWSTHYLHRQKTLGRIDMTKVLYVVDEGQKAWYVSTGGKKFFMHKDEVERFKKEVYPNIRRRATSDYRDYCGFCRQKLALCFAKPCEERRAVLLDEKAKELGAKLTLSVPFTKEKTNGRRKG